MISYNEFTVNELLAAVKSGDDDACAELLRRYAPLIDRMVYSTLPQFESATRADEDELRQEAAIKLYQAALSYDTAQEDTSFGLYAKICIKNRMISLVRRQSGAVTVTDVDDLYDGDAASTARLALSEDDPSTLLLDRERERELEGEIKTHLSALEYEVYDLYMDGIGANRIAEILGLSVKTVENALYRMRGKIGKLLSRK